MPNRRASLHGMTIEQLIELLECLKAGGLDAELCESLMAWPGLVAEMVATAQLRSQPDCWTDENLDGFSEATHVSGMSRGSVGWLDVTRLEFFRSGRGPAVAGSDAVFPSQGSSLAFQDGIWSGRLPLVRSRTGVYWTWNTFSRTTGLLEEFSTTDIDVSVYQMLGWPECSDIYDRLPGHASPSLVF